MTTVLEKIKAKRKEYILKNHHAPTRLKITRETFEKLTEQLKGDPSYELSLSLWNGNKEEAVTEYFVLNKLIILE